MRAFLVFSKSPEPDELLKKDSALRMDLSKIKNFLSDTGNMEEAYKLSDTEKKDFLERVAQVSCFLQQPFRKMAR